MIQVVVALGLMLGCMLFLAYWLSRTDVQREMDTFTEASRALGHELVRFYRIDRLVLWLSRKIDRDTPKR